MICTVLTASYCCLDPHRQWTHNGTCAIWVISFPFGRHAEQSRRTTGLDTPSYMPQIVLSCRIFAQESFTWAGLFPLYRGILFETTFVWKCFDGCNEPNLRVVNKKCCSPSHASCVGPGPVMTVDISVDDSADGVTCLCWRWPQTRDKFSV